jgi:hypothetical protein
LHDEISGEILRLGLASFLAPQAHQSGFIVAHDHPGVRAADENAAARRRIYLRKFVYGASPYKFYASIDNLYASRSQFDFYEIVGIVRLRHCRQK